MLLIIFLFMLVLLAILNYYIGKTLLYPPVVFSLWWALLLFSLVIAGDIFYEISAETLLIYFMGAFAFSLGGIIPFLVARKNIKSVYTIQKAFEYKSFHKKVINAGLLISLIVLPFFWFKLREIATLSHIDNFWVAIRYETVYGSANLGFFRYFLGVLNLFTIFSYLESLDKISKTDKIKAYFVIVIAIIYNLLLMQRIGIIFLVFAFIGVKFIYEGEINFQFLFKSIAVLVILFGIPAVLLGKGGSIHNSFIENIKGVSKMVALYTLGGAVGFNNVVMNPSRYIGTGFTTFRFFYAVLDRIGLAHYNLPKMVPIYTDTPLPTNVYTIYYTYFLDYGYLGVFILMFIIGIFSSLVFKRAYIKKEKIYIFLYGMVFAGLIISCANEFFFTTVSYWIQAIIFLYIIYRFPKLLLQPVKRCVEGRS
ncbi:O-antigen polymerase [Caldanaerobacter subterraneus]|uniref:Oligosaccharide repeat unit polymerase n=1 Tax=Caldanaerobacter subterraneus TaxID=911092 RepID=A0A4R2JTJ0_9THEO|nr:O-antigen polymerase [Caldanaerobacter subterraneus]TCO60259.1 oligosaccharide repeat unit polymerase [Caldanaerobacter subterraneus]